MEHEIRYEAVKRAYDLCTWGNSTETASDWDATLKGNDEDAKARLFHRMFLESMSGDVLRGIFSAEQIRNYLKGFSKPLGRAHLERRRKVWRFLYLNERNPIPELDWVIRR